MPVKKQNKKLKNRTSLRIDGQKNATKQDIKRLGTMIEAMDRRLRSILEKS